MNKIRYLCLATCLFMGWASSTQAVDLIFTGTIITVDENQPTAEAVAVSGDKIVAVGNREAILELATDSTRMIDLGEHVLLPGFIDAHGHMAMYGSLVQMVNLSSPPVGPVKNMQDVVDILKAKIKENNIPAGEWIFDYCYDDSLIVENRHQH